VRTLRERLSEELQARTELQNFMRHCIDDVRRQISDVQGAWWLGGDDDDNDAAAAAAADDDDDDLMLC
jgi:hypothetical protein